MQIDLAYAGPPFGVEEAARRAPYEGYRGLWTSESKHDPFVTLALATRACPQLTIGSGVAVALARSPFTLAQSAWDLAQLSGGKFILGLGSQIKAHITKRFSMPWDKPVGQMREMVAALRAIWEAFQTGQPLQFEGQHYRHTLLTPNFSPGPSEHVIPIGLAAVGPQMTVLAGEIADFALLHPFNHPEFVKTHTLPALRRGLERGGRARQALGVVGTVFAFVEDEDTARRDSVVRHKIGFYGSTPAYHGVLEALGRIGLGEKLHALSRQGAWSEMGKLVDDELLDTFRVRAGTREELFEKVRQRFSGLYDRVILTVPGE
jgi:probable F420-dependent oxidoreductase